MENYINSFLPNIAKVEVCFHNQVAVLDLSEVPLDPEVANVVELNLFFIVFHQENFRKKLGFPLLDQRRFDDLLIIFHLFCRGMEMLCVGERVSINLR